MDVFVVFEMLRLTVPIVFPLHIQKVAGNVITQQILRY